MTKMVFRRRKSIQGRIEKDKEFNFSATLADPWEKHMLPILFIASLSFTVPYLTNSVYRFPSLFGVGTYRHFGQRILNSQIKSPFLTGKLSIWTIFPIVNKQIRRKKVRE
jgi:hypothetical protein